MKNKNKQIDKINRNACLMKSCTMLFCAVLCMILNFLFLGKIVITSFITYFLVIGIDIVLFLFVTVIAIHFIDKIDSNRNKAIEKVENTNKTINDNEKFETDDLI